MFYCANYAQDKDSLIEIKGYYYTFFNKEEVAVSYEQRVKKIRKEPYSIPIDFTKYSYFIPTQIGDKVLNNSLNISLDSIFFMPDNIFFNDYIAGMFDKEIDLTKEVCILFECNSLSQFYTVTNNENILVKCFYLEGHAKTKQIGNIEAERFKFNLDIYAVNRNAEYLNLFFIVKINNYTICIDNPNVQLWQPYLGNVSD